MYLWRLKFYNCHMKHSKIWLVLPTPGQWKSTVWTWVSCAGCFLLMNGLGTRLTAQQLYYILHTSSHDLHISSLNISVIISFWMLSINLKILCSRIIEKCRQTLTATAELNTIFIDTCYHFRRVKVYSGRLRWTQNVLLMISKYAKVLEYLADVACLLPHKRMYSVQCSDKIRFPQLDIKCSVAKSCTGTHTALQAPMYGCYSVLYRFVLLLVMCELDMSNWQKGYDWVKSLVFLEAIGMSSFVC